MTTDPQSTDMTEEERSVQCLMAPFVKTLNRVFRFNLPWEEWGFVIFRATAYGPEHEDQWQRFRLRWNEIMDDLLAPLRGSDPRVDKAIDLIRFQWVEDPALDGAEPAEIAAEMSPSRGLDHSVCLAVTRPALESLLESPLPSSAPRRERSRIPFVVTVASFTGTMSPVDEEEDIAGQDFKGYFNVAVESLLEEFFPIVALEMSDLHKVAVRLRGEDIWCSNYRGGVHRVTE
ncbi:hypothetical protein N7474_010089 [Penicillium riverlandense]|uniref:uncharacterized protein n=1 Tax=Penicillium riverlandense TaxID=1903569 RepID=UPI002547D549|nr:uncharacterized protein N7474_010089 [Penicillium riverlandense]KAJ5808820.1 hypothetical protein N7474_010089 [Penicillium riverlandense]